jgi:salicylate hydroxylase
MKVAVIGAGLSGLVFAAAMKQKSPDARVELYERDEGPFSRPQGYAIGLRGDAGLKVLGDLGLRGATLGSDAVKVTRFVICDQDGGELLALGGGADDRYLTYRIQRAHIKSVLLDALGDSPIYYGWQCTGFEAGPADGVSARLQDGQRVEADYLVGCDGVASAIRQQMIGDDKRYLGLAMIHGEAAVRVDHPLLAGGYFMALGREGTSLFCYTQPGGVYFNYTVHADSEAAIANQPQEALLRRVREETRGWTEPIPTVVRAAGVQSIGVRGYYDKEPATKVRDGRVWLIGDAAHPMCPSQGQGANTGMRDALELAELLAGGADDAPAAALAENIVERGRKAVLASRAAARRFHETSRLRRINRDVGFRMGNLFLKLFSRSR